jgi:acetyl esterase/lipase
MTGEKMINLNRRTLITGTLATAAASALIRPSILFAADTPYELPLSMVHPELRPMVSNIAKYSKARPGFSRATLADARNPAKNPFHVPPVPDVPFERRVIPVGKPHPDVPIYIINAKASGNRPAILHTHGGGYVAGTAEDSIRSLQEICKELDCVAVSVDYRLAPETSYKGSIEDNYAGLKWLRANAASLGADPNNIAVMGESAGGGHAAILALTARDRGEVPLVFQCLIYPMLDDRTGSTVQKPHHVGTLIWTPESNVFGWESFLGHKPGLAGSNGNAVPARVANLKGLPPAFIGVGTLDLFCDEDIDYGQRLNAAGVLCETIVVPGAFHGFDMMSLMMKMPLGTWFQKTKMDALRRGFGMAAV